MKVEDNDSVIFLWNNDSVTICSMPGGECLRHYPDLQRRDEQIT